MDLLMRRVRAFGALLAFLIIFMTFGVLAATPAHAATAAEVEQQFFEVLNNTRRANGLAPLSNDGLLAQTARDWSQTMASTRQLVHDTNLSGIATFVDPTWTKVGENIGFGGSVNILWPLFMNSPPHRDNILGAYNKVGVGVVIDAGGAIWVTTRFLKGAALPAPPGPPAPPGIVPDARYVPLTPARILDTRPVVPHPPQCAICPDTGIGMTSVGNAAMKIGPRGSLDVPVLGVGGVPAAGVTAVAVNVTVVSPSATSFLTVYPRGLSPRPTTSNLNFGPGQTIADLVVARVGSGGMVSVFNNSGAVDVVADVVGYFNDGTAVGTKYTSVTPTRLLDTRGGIGAPQAKVGPGGSINVQMTGRSPLPTSKVTAVALNVTVVNTTANSHLTVWPADVSRPTASNINFGPVQTVPNMVIAKVSANGQISFFNNSGQTDILADVVGYFDDGTTNATTYTALNPKRILDTRSNLGISGKVGAGQTASLMVRGKGGVAQSAKSVIMTITATGGSAASHITAFPSGITKPDASNLNFVAGQTVPNLVIVGIGADGKVNLFNNAGTVDVLGDVVGYLS